MVKDSTKRIYTASGLATTIIVGCVTLYVVRACAVASPADAYARWAGGGIYTPGKISYSRECDCIIVPSPTTGRGDLYGISPRSGEVVWSLSSDSNEIYPSVTADGNVVFSRHMNGSYIAVSHGLSRADECKLLADSSEILSPALLPDLSAIVFSRRSSGAPASLTEIWIKTLPHGGEKQLTHNSVHDGIISTFSDSRRIVYNSSYSQVCLLDLGTGRSSVVCSGAFPALSIDERSVYCIRKRPTTYAWDLVKHDIDTGHEVLYKRNGSYMSAVCCLPGDRVAVIYDVLRDRVGKLAVLDTSNGQWGDIVKILDIAK